MCLQMKDASKIDEEGIMHNILCTMPKDVYVAWRSNKKRESLLKKRLSLLQNISNIRNKFVVGCWVWTMSELEQKDGIY